MPPRTGWEAELREDLQDVAGRFEAAPKLLSGFAPEAAEGGLAVGDELLFGVSLENGRRQRAWYLRLEVIGLEVGHGLAGRPQTAFERRVRPRPERMRRLRTMREQAWAKLQETPRDQWFRFECARIQVEAFDGDARSLASAQTLVQESSLRRIFAACAAGHRQRDRMRGRVVLGDDAELLELDDAGYDDVICVAEGVGACRLLFRLLKANPVTRDILFEVISLPTLWSILSTMRIRTGMEVDFFKSERVAPNAFPSAGRSLWSVPVTVLLNDQPALYAVLVAGPDRAPDAAAAGVFSIVGRHPTDPRRRIFVQLLASRRGKRP